MKSLWFVSLENVSSKLSTEYSPSVKGVNVEQPLKMFSTRAFKVFLNVLTETAVQVCLQHEIHKVVVPRSRSGHETGGVVPSWKDYAEQKNNIQNISLAETTILQVLTCKELGCNKPMKNNCVLIECKQAKYR